MHERGIEPRSPAWQARILPLNQQCVGTKDFRKEYIAMAPIQKTRLSSNFRAMCEKSLSNAVLVLSIKI